MSKIVFANQLRGIAALLIVITHYFGVYYGMQAVVAGVTHSPDLHLVAAGWVQYLDFPYFKGPFGVAVFFLISGFVIPFSLQQFSSPGFLLARLLRIYPTYLCCLAIGMLIVYGGAHYWGLPFEQSRRMLLANALLLHNLFGYGSLDTVNWTLAIEIKFYLLAALCAGAFLRGRLRFVLAAAAAIVGFDALLPLIAATPALQPWNTALSALAMDANYIAFMLIGVLFYQHLRGALSTARLVVGALLLLAAFALAWKLGPQHDSFAVIFIYYAYALAAFALCYAARRHFRPVRVLDFLADISYPLYAVHSLTGFTLLKIVMDRGAPFPLAVAIVLPLVVGLAYLIHVGVELSATAWGKRLAGAL
ncbi:acyltransferase [Rugamonas sp.]|uniref:acyltransferase family protein n=1 Tax=Rugamonas sp. TaxID=1926287 RepID=UPI0025F8B93D|nr:acyltransferase [Rugamonas sp.]